MSTSIAAARAALVSAVRMYMPVHSAVSSDAANALDIAMTHLEEAAIADAKVPATPPPVSPAAQRPAKAVEEARSAKLIEEDSESDKTTKTRSEKIKS